MDGHIEPMSALIRIGGAYGEPWTWAGVLRYDSPTSITVEGVERAPTLAEWKAAVRVVDAAGITDYRLLRSDGAAFAEHRHHIRRDSMKAVLTLKFENDGKQTSKTELELNNVSDAVRLSIENDIAALLASWRDHEAAKAGK